MSEVTKKKGRRDNSSSQMRLLGGTPHMYIKCSLTKETETKYFVIKVPSLLMSAVGLGHLGQ